MTPDPLPPSRRVSLTRRQWLRRGALAVGAAAIGVAAYSVYVEPHWLEIVRRDLPIENLPASWQDKTLVQLSDIHVGRRVSDAYLLDSFRLVRELQPELVVVTGDFLTLGEDGEAPWNQMSRVYRDLPRGSLGTFGVPGNHDYGRHFRDRAVADRTAELVADCGVTLLRNAATEVDGLQLIGMDELLAGAWDGRRALADAHAGPSLVLCHHPDAADRAGWGDYRGWILSGHTHGGQVKLPYLPPPVSPVRNKRYLAGEIDLYDGRRMYISRGLGHSAQIRFNVRPEITVFRLTVA